MERRTCLRRGFGRQVGTGEQLITLTEATRHLPKVDGKKVSVCTLWRWCRKGLRGVFLEYVRVGRKTCLRRGCRRQVCTTGEAMLRLFTEPAQLDQRMDADPYAKPASLKGSLPKAITSRRRQRALGRFRKPKGVRLEYH